VVLGLFVTTWAISVFPAVGVCGSAAVIELTMEMAVDFGLPARFGVTTGGAATTSR
jgi:hypothetical protein